MPSYCSTLTHQIGNAIHGRLWGSWSYQRRLFVPEIEWSWMCLTDTLLSEVIKFSNSEWSEVLTIHESVIKLSKRSVQGPNPAFSLRPLVNGLRIIW
jgi:hypothetical protein